MEPGDLPNDETRTVEATETSFRIIQTLKQFEGAGVTEIANEVDLTKSTVHKHLSTLRKLGYVIKDGTTYWLAVGFLELGVAAQSRLKIYEPAKQPLMKLSEATGEIASLMVPEHGRGVYVHRVVPIDAQEPPVHEGERVPLHATAGGKAILAYTPPEIRTQIFDYHGLETSTDATITDFDEINQELQNIRDTRTAYDRGEYFNGWVCVAAPITDSNQHAVGAVTVSIPEDRVGERLSKSQIPNFIGSTVNSIQNRI